MDRKEWARIEALARAAQADVHMVKGRKHVRIVLTKNEQSRFVMASLTPSDHRATLNRLRDVRQALQHLSGAK